MKKLVKELIAVSQRYGGDEAYVLAGGGNTSAKNTSTLWVKASGSALATIGEEGFVRLDRRALAEMWNAKLPKTSAAREAAVTGLLLEARQPGQDGMRPSVETLLHDMMPQTYVVHTHPSLVNAITCSQQGEKAMKRLFGETAVWIPEVNPGWTMAQLVKKCLDAAEKVTGKSPQVIMLQNHGLVVAADSIDEIERISRRIMARIKKALKAPRKPRKVSVDLDRAADLAPAIRMLCGGGGAQMAIFEGGEAIQPFVKSAKAFKALSKPFSPDHIVYTHHEALFVAHRADLEKQFTELEQQMARYTKRNGHTPKIVVVERLGFYACGKSIKDARTARELYLDAVAIAGMSSSFGGPRPMAADKVRFIRNWEAEQYRKGVAAGRAAGRLDGRVVLVTGSAQGFGKGIAEGLVAQGATLVLADLNLEKAQENAEKLTAEHGAGRAMAVKADVGNEESVAAMIQATLLSYGGIDLYISNAGILRAGGLEEMTLQSFDLMTRINYTAFFLGTKYAARPMRTQHRFAPGRTGDIIQVNSKSGLAGSKNNFAYAGTKFGSIGLVQSFALELVEDGIKVNAVCPGNYFGGPLWDDPKTGLFVQYLNAGKVPGAKTIADVRASYEGKVPMKRGCGVDDVVSAILYLAEQPYETGQALPVTGGQIMLK